MMTKIIPKISLYINELLEIVNYVRRDVLSCHVHEPYIDFVWDLVDLRVFLQKLNEAFDRLGEVYLVVVVEGGVGTALYSDVVARTVFEGGVL